MKQLERRLIKLEAQTAASGPDGGPLQMGGITREDIAQLSEDELDALIAADSPYDEYQRIKRLAAPEREDRAREETGGVREATV